MNDPHVTDTDLELYVIGGLAAGGVTAIETHVKDCEACAKRLQKEASLEVAVREVALAKPQPRASVATEVALRRWRRVAYACAAGLAVAAGIGALSGLRGPPPVAAGVPSRLAFVAAHDLVPGAVLSGEDVTLASVANELITPHTLSAGDDFAAGRRLEIPLHKGALLMTTYFEPFGELDSVGAGIRMKGRAMTIAADGVSQAARGDRVDLVASVRDPRTGTAVTITALQNLTVLEVRPANVATLLVQPDEAAVLQQVRDQGTVHLAIRNPEDGEVRKVARATTQADIVAGDRERELLARRNRLFPRPTATPADARPPASAEAAAQASASSPTPAAQLDSVLVAAKALHRGVHLAAEDVKELRLPHDRAAADMVPATRLGEIVGQTLRVSLGQGDVVVGTALSASGDALYVGSRVPKQLRGATVAIPGPLRVRPGDRVDVLTTVKDPASGSPLTTTLLQDVEVLGVETASRDGKEPDRVTLAVLPEEGELLVEAAGSGTLGLSVRNPGDAAEADVPPHATTESVLNNEHPGNRKAAGK